ncbi:hypothetical protein LCGC14_3025680 [marine sediment metagenome]|uniref:Uncharacterized protein n=1 Tax=marine sediment metagenome TaxID=412755 RepID=A0A0F8ZK24_9ZZZZ
MNGSGAGAPPKAIGADTIVHELDGLDYHRLIVNGTPGEWFPPGEIACKAGYYATIRPQGAVEFPVVFSVVSEPFETLPATEDVGGDPE